MDVDLDMLGHACGSNMITYPVLKLVILFFTYRLIILLALFNIILQHLFHISLITTMALIKRKCLYKGGSAKFFFLKVTLYKHLYPYTLDSNYKKYRDIFQTFFSALSDLQNRFRDDASKIYPYPNSLFHFTMDKD